MKAVSVITPTYNDEQWILDSLRAALASLKKSGLKSYELIVVNDGSTDGTRELLDDFAAKHPNVKVIHQENKGRFLARQIAIGKAKYDHILMLDSRVVIDEGALSHVVRTMKESPEHKSWNGHVRIRSGWNVFSRFWNALTFIAWRRYFAHPRLVRYGAEDFDYYPKGTGIFLASKALLQKHIDAFRPTIKDLKFVSDDTALLRGVAKDTGITLSPQFGCEYTFGRSTVGGFVKHTFKRGINFIDGFLKPGNRFFVPLVMVLAAMPMAVFALVLWPLQVAGAAVTLWLASLLLAITMRVPLADALSLWIVSPLFALAYAAGLWRGVAMVLGQRRRWLPSFVVAAVVYLACTAFYMGGALTQCGTKLLSIPADSTAGMIALFSVDNADPWWGYTTFFSYPFGEQLGQPFQITAQTSFIPFWVFAKLFGPVCSFNILVLLGFMSAALTMFGFVRWLLKPAKYRWWIALFAGYAVAFTPYLQIKTGAHLSYVFEGMLIGLVWSLLAFWLKPTWRKAVLVGVLAALCVYTDGYFILLAGLLGASVLVGLVLHGTIVAREKLEFFVRRMLLLIIALLAAVVALLPVAYVQLTYRSQIDSVIAGSRDSIERETQVYGARPKEYILPNAFNPLLSPLFGNYSQRDNHGSNPAENVLSISWAVFALAGVAVLWGWRKQKARDEMTVLPTKLLVIVGLSIVIVAGAFSLAPVLGPFKTPSALLISLTQLWRVVARLSVVVNIGMVMLASVGLAMLLLRISSAQKVKWVVAGLFAVIFVEYLTFIPPRPVYGYDSAPSSYTWLRQQGDIQEIAEYPLDDFAASGYPIYYSTYQRIHGKRLLNGITPEMRVKLLHHALQSLDDPQTIPTLRQLGIDAVVMHTQSAPTGIKGLSLVNVSREPLMIDDSGAPGYVGVYRLNINSGVTPPEYVAAAYKGFHSPYKASSSDVKQEMGSRGELKLICVGILKCSNDDSVTLRMTIQSASRLPQDVVIEQHGKRLLNLTARQEAQDVAVKVASGTVVDVVVNKPSHDPTIYIDNLSVKSE